MPYMSPESGGIKALKTTTTSGSGKNNGCVFDHGSKYIGISVFDWTILDRIVIKR